VAIQTLSPVYYELGMDKKLCIGKLMDICSIETNNTVHQEVSVQGLSHSRHITVISETSLSMQLIALVEATKNKETKHHIYPKHKR